MSTYSANFNQETYKETLIKEDIEKKGQAFTGTTKVDKVDYTRSGDTPLNNFPCQDTSVPKKGKPWVPKTQTTAPPINTQQSGGSQYQGIEGVGKQ